MSNTKFGIEYTVFKFEGSKKIPVVKFKGIPNNIRDGMKLLERRLGNIDKKHKILSMLLVSFMYGYSITGLRVVIG